MILESVVTTVSPTGELNVAPMGPDFDPAQDAFELRPFEDSQTYRNLISTECGVLHVTDNVLLIASSAINEMPAAWQSDAAEHVDGRVLHDCCRWYEFRCIEKPSTTNRKTIHCEIVGRGRKRDFYGFNRAKHAILEATIAVTRIGFLPTETIAEKLASAADVCGRTGGPDEFAAIELLQEYVRNFSDGVLWKGQRLLE